MKVIALFNHFADGDGYATFELKQIYATLDRARQQNPTAVIGKRAEEPEYFGWAREGPDILEEIEVIT